ncbi:30S ribosomal protein S17 [Candidatus Margulisiibacteriota bacterium]
MESKKRLIKKRDGIVVSDKMDKTAVVRVARVFRHPLFNKVVKSYKKFKAHDPENKCKVGNKVIIEETRPTSKDKRWKIKEIRGHDKVIEKVHPGRLHKEPVKDTPGVTA